MPLSNTSHISPSPSLTSSVDSVTSSSISSLKGQESDLVIQPQHINFNFPLDNGCVRQPSIGRMPHIALNIEPLHCTMPASANYLPSVFHEDDTNLSGDQQPVRSDFLMLVTDLPVQ